MATLTCPDCGTAVLWTATGCPGCGAPFREIRCAECKYVGLPERFLKQRCPRCRHDGLRIVPLLGNEVDEVGEEAFVEGVPLADEIERSFSKSKSRDSGPAPPGDLAPTDRTAPVSPAHGEAPTILKRQHWTKSAPADAETPPPKQKVRATKQEPVTERKKRRFSVEISPKAQQILRWSGLALPGVLLVSTLLYLFDGRDNRRSRPIAAASTNAADPAALEAQAQALYDSAVEQYRAGKIEEAMSTLQQIISLFPLTHAGTLARNALDRMSRGQPPFDDAAAPPSSNQAVDTVLPPLEVSPAPRDEPKKKAVIGIPKRTPQNPPPATSAGSDQQEASTAAVPAAPPQGSTLERADAQARSLPDGFVAVQEAGVHSSGWPIEIVCLRDQSHMVLVPSGEFEMGNAEGAANVQPVHRVYLTAYYIDRYEITLLQYKHFLQQRRLKNQPYRELSRAALAAAQSDHHAVVGVAWRDAHAYAAWAGKALPTESQWEKAARGTDGRRFPWGTAAPVWERERRHKQLDRIGSFAWDVSIYGCFDMAGGAWEWCSDWYDPNYYSNSQTSDPEGPAVAPPPVSFTDPEKVIRGGAEDWDVTWRGFSGIEEQPLHVGFRCVLEVERAAPRLASESAVEAPRQSQPPAVPMRIPPGGYKF